MELLGEHGVLVEDRQDHAGGGSLDVDESLLRRKTQRYPIGTQLPVVLQPRSTPVPSSIRWVTAASIDNATSGSRNR